MTAIAAEGVSSTMRRFEKGEGPDGVQWPVSLRARLENGQTLVKSGRLRDSFGTEVTATSAEWGTNVAYAAIHQFGGTITAKTARGLRFQFADGRWATKRSVTIPARPFLGIDDRDEDAIRHTVDTWLKGLVAL
jgi:phage virion morphogenesis protein